MFANLLASRQEMFANLLAGQQAIAAAEQAAAAERVAAAEQAAVAARARIEEASHTALLQAIADLTATFAANAGTAASQREHAATVNTTFTSQHSQQQRDSHQGVCGTASTPSAAGPPAGGTPALVLQPPPLPHLARQDALRPRAPGQTHRVWSPHQRCPDLPLGAPPLVLQPTTLPPRPQALTHEAFPEANDAHDGKQVLH